ncbi:radical SAM protein, partial [Rheinheimera baltica]|uniref:radical SAM protein n=1 Tax=Rheinheimera baltica TaxID=67576 RepID=UPI00273ED014
MLTSNLDNPMSKSIYLINPNPNSPSYYGGEIIKEMGYKKGVLIADLVIPTVAAFVPKDFTVTLCDEYITDIDFDLDVDYVGITGRVDQKNRMIEIAKEFRQRGVTVLFGGSFASLSPEQVREHCDILVIGEIEEIAENLFNDLRNGCFKSEYIGTKPDLKTSPIPRWDLYPNHRAATGTIQTSRGCPYSCEFCDVIVYLGQKQRHKSVEQVIAELEVQYAMGYRAVFLADDNFTVKKSHAKALLRALRDWNHAHASDPIKFRTQVSTEVVQDTELMQLCAEAGLDQVFIGIESPNKESMKEVKKHQNVKVEMASLIQTFYSYGIFPQCGMMVGFDADDKDIFERQFELAMQSNNPYFTLSSLVAPDATPLYKRLENEGRIAVNNIDPIAGSAWGKTNIVTKNLTAEELNQGIKWLCSNLYAPKNFSARFMKMIDSLDRSSHPLSATDFLKRPDEHIYRDITSVAMKVKTMGPEEKKCGMLSAKKWLKKVLAKIYLLS